MPDYEDASEITTVTTPSASDVYDGVDAQTIDTTTTLSTTLEEHATYDVATVTTSTTPLSTLEEHATYDATTIATQITVSYEEAGPYYDAATIPTSVTVAVIFEVYIHPAGFWGPFDTDDGRIPATFTDAKTVSIRTQVSGVDEYN